MPIYEYRCDACGHELDALQKLSDDPLRDCPACESEELRRLISAPSFRLKGDGWYETDFKSDKETKRNLVDGGGSNGRKESKAADSGKGAKKDDSKPKADKPAASNSKKDSGAATN
jgi:putative FmdB family regulatory protein